MKAKIAAAALFVLCASNCIFAQVSSGSARGNLILTGGDVGNGVIERFVALAGGPDANFVYVPTPRPVCGSHQASSMTRQTPTLRPQIPRLSKRNSQRCLASNM